MIGVVGTFQDISDRKQAEDNLKNERLRLQLALDAAKWEPGVVVLNPIN